MSKDDTIDYLSPAAVLDAECDLKLSTCEDMEDNLHKSKKSHYSSVWIQNNNI